jgi:hypothetical protein
MIVREQKSNGKVSVKRIVTSSPLKKKGSTTISENKDKNTHLEEKQHEEDKELTQPKVDQEQKHSAGPNSQTTKTMSRDAEVGSKEKEKLKKPKKNANSIAKPKSTKPKVAKS